MNACEWMAARLPSEVRARIADFWQSFAARADALDDFFTGQGKAADPVEIMEALRQVSPDLMWEFGPSERGHRLAITAEWRSELVPLAQAVVQAAPDLPRWEIVDVRPPVALDDYFIPNAEARLQAPITVTRIDVEVTEWNRLRLIAQGPEVGDVSGHQALILAEQVLGERGERDWIGPVEGRPVKAGLLGRFRKAEELDLEAFKASLEAAIAEVEARRPDVPYAQSDPDRETHLFQLDGFPADATRSDLQIYACSEKAFAEAVLGDLPLSSVGHSAFGEVFLGLRLDGAGLDPSARLSERQELEVRLQEVLGEAGVGGVVGAGHGHAFSYIDLALTDIDAGIALIEAVLAEADLISRADLRFLEQGLTDMPLPLTNPARPN